MDETDGQAMQTAGFWRRVVALAVDMLILCLFGTAVGLMFFARLAPSG